MLLTPGFREIYHIRLASNLLNPIFVMKIFSPRESLPCWCAILFPDTYSPETCLMPLRDRPHLEAVWGKRGLMKKFSEIPAYITTKGGCPSISRDGCEIHNETAHRLLGFCRLRCQCVTEQGNSSLFQLQILWFSGNAIGRSFSLQCHPTGRYG